MSGFLAVYMFDASQDESIDLFSGARFKDRTSTQAVFGELTWNITADIDLTVGSRYEQEERDRTGGQAPFVIDYHETFSVFLPRATLAVRSSENWTVGGTVGRGYNAGGAGFAFNPPFPSFTYDQETVWNYEGFARSSLLDGRLRLNGNLFCNDYSGLQLPFDVAQNPAAPATVIRNAEQATTYGAEVELRFRALESLDVFGGVGLLRTKVDRYSDPSVQGRDLPRSPALAAEPIPMSLACRGPSSRRMGALGVFLFFVAGAAIAVRGLVRTACDWGHRCSQRGATGSRWRDCLGAGVSRQLAILVRIVPELAERVPVDRGHGGLQYFPAAAWLARVQARRCASSPNRIGMKRLRASLRSEHAVVSEDPRICF